MVPSPCRDEFVFPVVAVVITIQLAVANATTAVFVLVIRIVVVIIIIIIIIHVFFQSNKHFFFEIYPLMKKCQSCRQKKSWTGKKLPPKKYQKYARVWCVQNKCAHIIATIPPQHR